MKEETKENAALRLKDAIEFLESAKTNIMEKRYKAALLDSGDAAIAANDALTVCFIGKIASRDHSEAISLHRDVGRKINENEAILLHNLIADRHKKGYRAFVVSSSVAEKSVRNAIKFVDWVKDKLRKQGIEI